MYIPIIGTLAYVLIFEFTINKLVIEGNKQLKKIKKYKTIANLVSILVAVPFIVCFFIFRNTNGFGAFP